VLKIKDLPVYRHKEEILKALEHNQVLIVESPTGSGKTTQLPLILQEAGYDKTGIIGITQPRRIATLSISDFICRQLELGEGNHYCAYTMRFADTTDSTTRIKIMTDGILLQELKADPLLAAYSVIMVDEAHERSLNIDFILGLLRGIAEKRRDLKIIISSATINTKAFSTFFSGAPIVSIAAGCYPVDVRYVPFMHPVRMLTDKEYGVIGDLIRASVANKEGDILVFLPGEYDILAVKNEILDLSSQLVVYPLYGRLSKEEQERVFTPTPAGKTKVVISTNIAETSITIDGIRVVIDSGLMKVNFYNQRNFTSSLETATVSKSSAVQRAGRAGRTQSGICYRLYTEDEFNAKEEYAIPEILRSDLAEVVFRMSELGIYDYENFPFITSPKTAAIKSAEETLHLIKAIDGERHLTAIGEMMVKFPLLPRHSRVIVEAVMAYPEILKEAIIAVSFLSTKGPFLRPDREEMLARKRQSQFQNSVYGDFVGYLQLFNKYSQVEGLKAQEKFCKHYYLDLQTMNEIMHIEEQLEEIVSKDGIPITSGGSVDSYLTCLAAGLIQFVCFRYTAKAFRTISAREIYIHPGSSWFDNPPKFILAGEIVQTSRMFARSVSPLKKSYLDTIDPTLANRLMNEKGEEGRKKDKEDSLELSLRLFERSYPYSVTNGKVDRKTVEVPFEDLPYLITEGFKRGRVKAIKVHPYVKVGKKRAFGDRLSLKNLVSEGSIVPLLPPLPYSKDQVFVLKGAGSELADFISDNLFRLKLNKDGNRFGYLGLAYISKTAVGFRPYYDLNAVLDSSFSLLGKLKNSVKDKKVKAAAEAQLSRINMLEDF
jgi:HrpA-like helicases